MIDANATTVDWQHCASEVAILPIGSIEQHAGHMPIATDWLFAQDFAKIIAADLDAALLPAQPYANCLEHSGFRGSFSLRPETLMHIVRDLAEEVERQRFKILIVLNGHGGNFSLTPAVRYWNRQDRPLKILLVNWWEYCDPKLIPSHPRPEVHCGEWETSLMMALHPDLVRRALAAGMPVNPKEPYPLERRDLTTFGIGHFNVEGAAGFPAAATPEKGRAILASIKTRILPWIRDRIERLRQNPRYAAPGAAGASA